MPPKQTKSRSRAKPRSTKPIAEEWEYEDDIEEGAITYTWTDKKPNLQLRINPALLRDGDGRRVKVEGHYSKFWVWVVVIAIVWVLTKY